MNGTTNPDQRQFPDLDEFEALRIDPEQFNHAAHVYVGWLMLSKYEPVEATLRFTGTLRRLVKKLDAEDKYHETISWFYMLLIAERRQRSEPGDWESFASENADLLGKSSELLQRHYSSERLWSRLARQQFLLPDIAT